MALTPLQPDHGVHTFCLLVYGWTSTVRADHERPDGFRRFLADTFGASLSEWGGVYVIADDVENRHHQGGEYGIVIGLPVARAHADDGPVEWSIDAARAIETRLAEDLPERVRTDLSTRLLQPLDGEPRWWLIPTGPLAGGYCSFGTLVPSMDEHGEMTAVAAGHELVFGTDMSQAIHPMAVDGACLATAIENQGTEGWQIQPVDLSPRRTEALRRRMAGRFFLTSFYD